MIVKVHDMRPGNDINGYRFVGEVELPRIPAAGERVSLTSDDFGFIVRIVILTADGPPQVRGW